MELFMGYAFILGAMVGLFFGYFWGEKRGIGRGFVNGWLARHRGEDGIPDQYADYMSTNDGLFMLSKAERELLKDPYERELRGLPPENLEITSDNN